jgi:hypothetical protein
LVKSKGKDTSSDVLITFFVAFCLIAFEIFLSRLFTVILDYNFVFLIVSLATLGIGLGGYIAYRWFDRYRTVRHTVTGLFALSMVLVVTVIYMLSYKGVIFYSVVSIIPFLLGGSVLAGIMQSQHRDIHLVYFADLLGAGLGAICVIFLMNVLGPIQTVGLLSFIMFLIHTAIIFKPAARLRNVTTGILLGALLFNLYQPFVNYTVFKAYETSPYNMFHAEKDAEIVYTNWDAFSRTDVYDAGDELFYMTIDGGAVSPISKFSGNLYDVSYLNSTTSSLAFHQKPSNKTLIIGVGGGQEVLTARMAGFYNIEAVDINESSFEAVHALSDATWDIFNREGVTAVASDGRNYIRETKDSYDLIYLSLVMKKSENGLGLALTENFIYTQEAIEEYMNKLTPDGRLAFLLHDETELNKILHAAKKYYQKKGVSEAGVKNFVAVIGTYQHLGHVVSGMGGSQITRPLIIMRNQPFDKETSQILLTDSKQIQQIPLHIPYVYDQYEALNDQLEKLGVNLEANRDDRPFFYNPSGQIPTTLWIALLVTCFAALFILGRKGFTLGQGVYFSGIAVGFMLIEITFIQKMILLLGHPTLSFVTVLGVLLVAGGIGSYYSKKWSSRSLARFPPLLLAGIFAVLASFALGWYYDLSLELSLPFRWIGSILLLLPVGFFMGMPFPFGLSRLHKHQIALSWGYNGIMTVAGSLLAAMLSLTFGFTMTITAGAIIYVLLFVLQPLLRLNKT